MSESVIGDLGKLVEMKAGEDVIGRVKGALDRAILLTRLSAEIDDAMFDPEKTAEAARKLLDAFTLITTAVSDSVISKVEGDAELIAAGMSDPREYLNGKAEELRAKYLHRINDALTGGAHAKVASDDA